MTTPRSFAIRGRALLPIVQGGMGVGVSAHRLAGAVARAGAVGTIASIDLRHHHADLTEQGKHCRDKDELNRLNFIALDREIGAALDIAAGHGLVAVNVMKAVDAHPAYVRQALHPSPPAPHPEGLRARVAGLPHIGRMRIHRFHHVDRHPAMARSDVQHAPILPIPPH